MPKPSTPLPRTPLPRRAWACAAAFVLQFAVLDVLLRGPGSMGRFTVPAVALSVLFWSLVLAACAGPKRRFVVSVLVALLVLTHGAVHRLYHVPLTVQVLESALASMADVLSVLRASAGTLALGLAVLAALEFALLTLAGPVATMLRRRALGSWPQRGGALAASCILLCLVPVTEGTFELGSRSLLRARTPHPAPVLGAEPVAPVVPRPGVTPSVLFIIPESVRAKDHCTNTAGSCSAAPYTHALMPDRIVLPELRSISSYTMISIWALLTGRAPALEREALGTAPTLFDVVRAGRFAQRPTLRYLSVQGREVIYRQSLLGVLDQSVTLESWVGEGIKDEEDYLERGVDRLLASRCEAELPQEHGPTVTVLHFAGTHAPYFVAQDHAPFTPWSHVASWGTLDALHNAYKNSILDQDRGVERCIRAFQQGQGQRPFIVVFTSDHGEAFGEHSAIHHGQNLYDEQTHVPGYLAAFNGAFSPEQERAIKRHATEPHTHLDLLPTVLDTLGILGAVGAGPVEAKLFGRSLLRDSAARWPVPVSNCTPIFPCPINTWGVLGETHLLTAQPQDGQFRCVPVGDQAAGESRGPACDELRKASLAFFPKLPNGQDNK
jgi:hypothetical protein